MVDPRAWDSVVERRVLVLEPLANPRHALSSIARMRRYAEELGYGVDPAGEAALWSVFDAADAAEREVMLDRFSRAATQGYGVLDEAMQRRARS